MGVPSMKFIRSRVCRIVLIVAIFMLSTQLYVSDNKKTSASHEYQDSVQQPLTRRSLHGAGSNYWTNNKTLLVPDQLSVAFYLKGALFNGKGKSAGVISPFKSSLIHSFSPEAENSAKVRFLDPPKENIYYANSPAVLWDQGNLLMICRIWLRREKHEHAKKWPSNDFTDNFLYTQRFDRHLRPINNGSILGIPSPKQFWVGDGPIEPRLFTIRGKVFVSFNVAMAFAHRKFWDWTVLLDYKHHNIIIPKIKGGSPMADFQKHEEVKVDKHWMAFEMDKQLHFVHCLDPLRILKCSQDGFCHFVHFEKKKHGNSFENYGSHLRGGTPFELYKWPYYIGVAHATLHKKGNSHRYYSAHIVVLCVKPYRVVFVSEQLQIHKKIYSGAPMVRAQWIDDGFIFPVGIMFEDEDTLDLGVHVNDFSSVLLRFRGISHMMDEVIRKDNHGSSNKSAPIGHLHLYVREVVSKFTGFKFKSK